MKSTFSVTPFSGLIVCDKPTILYSLSSGRQWTILLELSRAVAGKFVLVWTYRCAPRQLSIWCFSRMRVELAHLHIVSCFSRDRRRCSFLSPGGGF